MNDLKPFWGVLSIGLINFRQKELRDICQSTQMLTALPIGPSLSLDIAMGLCIKVFQKILLSIKIFNFISEEEPSLDLILTGSIQNMI